MIKKYSQPNHILELTVLNSKYWLSLCDQGENNRSEQQKGNKIMIR